MSSEELKQPALTVKNISKRFGGIQALQNVSFNINKGEVVALLGDNGAGKSTLVRCVSGIHPPDGGEILVNDQQVTVASPQDARELGIETVHQDLAVIPDFDIAANLFLNREILHKNPLLRLLGWLDNKAMREQAQISLQRLNSKVPDLTEAISRLSGGQRQAVAIARAVNSGADVVIMDEPTAALGVEQSAQVNELINLISSQGVAVLLISHNMQHVMETCDRAVVLLRGESIANVKISDVTPRDLVGFITGAQRLTA
ncbi:ATP-binding cassette domain-containing protein [Gilvimarinus algae]|uniref:ATP-binding cassette domain-containing protein n=1 Tax=Gilvimarinus algae TaxID=3058037 RepID=A0ABT8TBI2_9GAMM|nr:ATP-binding cassette domain-containing protein [Gilvimarinus sp. SDUM040014]MDO3381464.1 ATP-binding cassette domain-containing protein [Gilvimarinus sp. SDUM040014]